jgi:hypothetical protein
MPTVLGPELPISFPNTPPGMSAQDSVIWARFRPAAQGQFERFWANIRVGDGQPPLPGMATDATDLLQALTQHRIDLMLQGPRSLWLVEVRHNAGSGALGTILTNAALYAKDPVRGAEYTRVILTNDMDPDSRTAAEQAGVLVVIV